ncbi:uncharacterized protein ATNIH1004_001049 [Aspergillus tanneri]|uniref:Major facilitator superfamily (MFS) profile domain-containing protein n=1 Tax=Aspergillus tanneri TaxID=1220188 RepID=A0A5M9MYH3_9EURO|nr:uncharacterized protein ATNIH1004_001049 [Aspergillus tanneri]KAA8652145.1 hypothetical protein ATNIH1004_001049 [Aspergillus tanneri]
MIGVGSLCAAWISYGTYIGLAPTNNAQWQVPLGLQIIRAVFLGLLITFFPESPRWFIDHSHHENDLKTLAKLHGYGDENDPSVRAEYNQIQEGIVLNTSMQQSLTQSCSFHGRHFAVCFSVAHCKLLYYSVQIYGQVGIRGDGTLRYQAVNSIIALVAQFLCMVFIDRLGRRWTLVFRNVGNVVSFIVTCILLGQFAPEVNNTGAHWTSLL